MKTERVILSLLFFAFAIVIMTGSAVAEYDIDEEKMNISEDGYRIGVSNDGDDMMLMRILDTEEVRDAEVRHQAFDNAIWLAGELELKDFLKVYGGDEELFQERLDRKLNDLIFLEKVGMENGEYAPNLVRFFTQEFN